MSRRLVDGKKPSKPGPDAKKGGVPSVLELNPDISKQILNSVRMGNYLSIACRQFGVSTYTVQRWVAKGLENPKSLYGAFREGLQKALAEAEARDLATLDAFANGRPAQYDKNGKQTRAEVKPQWQAAAWKLERRAPKRWGRFDRVHMTAEDEAKEIDVTPDTEVTPQQTQSVLGEVKEILGAIAELEGEE